MAREPKSPRQKKDQEYTKNHFTFGWNSSRMFPKTWKRKKTRVNREYRRKTEELLVQAKSGMAADDVALMADDLTAARFQKSVLRKRLRKSGTVTVGEKVKRKLEKREEAVGRNVERRQGYDRTAATAVTTLGLLDGEQLVDTVRRAALLCGARNQNELRRVLKSNDPVDQALYFLYLVAAGSAYQIGAVGRSKELERALGIWIEKANRILRRDQRAAQLKLDQKQAARKKLKSLRNR